MKYASQFGVARTTLMRYCDAYNFVKKNNIENIQNLSPTILYLIGSKDVPDSVIEYIKSHTDEKINREDFEKFFNEKMKKQVEILDEELQQTKLELVNTKKALEQEARKSSVEELKVRKLEDQIRNLSRAEKDLEEEIIKNNKLIEEKSSEVKKLHDEMIERQKNPPPSTIEFKEILPKEYLSLEDAISAKQSELKKAELMLAELNSKLEDIKHSKVEFESKQKNIEEINQFNQKIDGLLESYSGNILKVLLSNDIDNDSKGALVKTADLLENIAKNIRDNLGA